MWDRETATMKRAITPLKNFLIAKVKISRLVHDNGILIFFYGIFPLSSEWLIRPEKILPKCPARPTKEPMINAPATALMAVTPNFFFVITGWALFHQEKIHCFGGDGDEK